MRTRVTLLLAAAILIAGSATPLAAKVDFSGTWKANVSKSNFGSLGEPKEFVRTIKEDGLHLIIAVKSSQNGVEETGELRFEINGEDSESMIGETKVTGKARELGQHILVLTDRNWDGMGTEILELWTLLDEGKTLRIDASVITSMGDEEICVIFDKQD
jgi:hypothetical protein